MTESVSGLVLRIRPLTETSLIVHWLTPSLGRIATVAKGARRPKSPFRGKLDLFYEAEFSFLRSRRSELHILRETVLVKTNAVLRQDIRLLRQASYAALLIEQTTETETPLGEVYPLMRTFLQMLPLAGADPKMVLGLELKLLGILGLAPDPSRTDLSPAAQCLLRKLAGAAWGASEPVIPSPPETQELERFLHDYILFHLGRLLPGRAAALDINAR
jgi:DNA repair protein RecO (recombination protein O)